MGIKPSTLNSETLKPQTLNNPKPEATQAARSAAATAQDAARQASAKSFGELGLSNTVHFSRFEASGVAL